VTGPSSALIRAFGPAAAPAVAVASLTLSPRAATLNRLAAGAGAGVSQAKVVGGGQVAPILPQPSLKPRPPRPPTDTRENSESMPNVFLRGGRDLNASGPGAGKRSPERSGQISGHLWVVSAAPDAPESGSARSTCSTVASEQDRRHEVAEALRKTMGENRPGVEIPILFHVSRSA